MNKKTDKKRQPDSGGIHLAEAAIANPQAVDADMVIAAAAQAILQSVPAIVEAIITKAKDGSYLHANFLFDFADLAYRDPAEDDEGEEQGSLADFLMKRLDAEAAAEPHSLKSKDEEKKPVNGHH
jgi:hypothetical protein